MSNKDTSKSISRRFVGPIIVTRKEDEPIEEYRTRRNMANKHLKAYLRGYQRYRYGYKIEDTMLGPTRIPEYFDVLSEIFYR